MLESYGFIMFSYAMSWYESAISLPLMYPRFIWIYHIPRIRIHRFSSSPVIFPPDLPWLFSRAGRCRVWAGHRDVPGLRKKAGVDIQVNHGKYHMGYHRRQYSNKGDPGKSTYPKWWYGFLYHFMMGYHHGYVKNIGISCGISEFVSSWDVIMGYHKISNIYNGTIIRYHGI